MSQAKGRDDGSRYASPVERAWASRHGLSTRIVPPGGRAGEPCPCTRDATQWWIIVAVALIAATLRWF